MFLKCLFLLLFCGFIDAPDALECWCDIKVIKRPGRKYEWGRYRPEKRCPAPHLENGFTRLKQRATLVRYTCRMRYTLVGNKYATCRDGEWDEPVPICVRSGCRALPPTPKNTVMQSSHDDAYVLFFCYPGYKLVGSPVIYCDGRQWNDTLPECVSSVDQTPKISCDFEEPDLCGWKQDEMHDFDWKRLNRRTPSSFMFTGPSFDHTYGKYGNGYFMYIEGSGPLANDTARLISPVYDSSQAIDACLVFYYHMYGKDIGGLRVYQKPSTMLMYDVLNNLENGTNKYMLFAQYGDQGNEWFSGIAPLLNVSDDFQIVIEGIRGRSFISDTAIDDVSIQSGQHCTDLKAIASTPSSGVEESCAGRCGAGGAGGAGGGRGCSCSYMCFMDDNCCADYIIVCEFGADTATDIAEPSDISSTIHLPATEKLVATTTAPPPPPSTTSSTTTSTTKPTTSTTISSTSTTTAKPTTVTTKRVIKISTTEAQTTSTTVKPTTTTTVKTTTVAKLNTTTLAITHKTAGTTAKVAVKTKTTLIPPGFTVKRPPPPKIIAQKQTDSGSNGITIAVVVVLVLGVCCGVSAYWLRTAYGRAALARVRGRTTRDPEVRFLKNDVDFEDDEHEQ